MRTDNISRSSNGGQTVDSRSSVVRQSFVSRLDGGQDGRVDRLGTTESISCLHLVVRQTVAKTVMSDRGIRIVQKDTFWSIYHVKNS